MGLARVGGGLIHPYHGTSDILESGAVRFVDGDIVAG